MNLRLKKKASGFTYSIPWPNRLFFALLLAVYLVSYQSEQSQPWYLHLIAFISILGLTYRESWTFDHQQQKVQHLFGIIFPWKRKTWDYKEVQSLTLQCFIRGDSGWIDPEADRKNMFSTHQSILKLETTKGDQILETGINRRSVVLQNTGQQLADELNCPFRINP